MENFLSKFPGVAQRILNQLDDQHLTKCKEVGRILSKFLEEDKLLWTRMIKKYGANHVEFKEAWKQVVEKVPVAIVKELAITTEQFYTFNSVRIKKQYSPHHIVAAQGCLSLLQFIVRKTKLLNPARGADELTALASAAGAGQLEICQYLINNLDDKNPKKKDGNTVLHIVAHAGHIEIVKCITKNILDKNPKNLVGFTPLDYAAMEGHLDVYKCIAEQVDNKNPPNNVGDTPIHWAARRGQCEIVRYIMSVVDERNITNQSGLTPMHLAVHGNHYETCQIIVENGDNSNPNNDGISALDLVDENQRIRDLILQTANI